MSQDLSLAENGAGQCVTRFPRRTIKRVKTDLHSVAATDETPDVNECPDAIQMFNQENI